MNATNGMLVWNPGTDQVDVVPWPEGHRDRRYPMSALACYAKVRRMTPAARRAMVFIEAMHLIVRDKCDPIAVHKALLKLTEYRSGLADDMPR